MRNVKNSKRSSTRSGEGRSAERTRKTSTRNNEGRSANSKRSTTRDNDAKPEGFSKKTSSTRNASNASDPKKLSNAKRHRDPETRFSDRRKSAEFLSAERLKGDKDKPARPSTHRPRKQKTSSLEGTRLNKYIAHAGVCSRRDADIHIEAGSVHVNEKIVTEMGYRVMPGDEVKFDGRRLNTEKKVYVLLNKPKNYITTTDDPQKRRTVAELIKGAAKERLYPVGRLDRNTTGVLLFTNDGDAAKKLTHPTNSVRKIYHVTLDKSLTGGDYNSIRDGVELADGLFQPDSISFIENGPKKEIGIEIHSGRNRLVRRVFEHFGYTVVKLDRVQQGFMTKKNLKRGQWRHLTEDEVSFLNMI